MGLYNIFIRPFVRNLELEKASKIVDNYYKVLGKLPFRTKIRSWLKSHSKSAYRLHKEVFGIQFDNMVGIGSGLDTKGEQYNELSNLGISFVQIGPSGKDGIRKAIANINRNKAQTVVAACIDSDYLTAFTLAYDFFDFFVIDITADPSTEYLDEILEARIAEQEYKPVVAKIPEYITDEELHEIIDYCLLNRVEAIESRSIEQIREIQTYSKGLLAIIANNHIDSIEKAGEAIQAGASLIEIRTALIKEGPGFVKKILKSLQNTANEE